jgi:predicted HTH transcriptional regulator
MIPKTLEEWTIESIRNLLAKKVFESDSFDFKVALPHSKNSDVKDHLKKTCCAFANSEGGFLVYGVSDDKELDSEERFEGVDPNIDFPAHFGNYPKMCSPSVEWEFKNPPIVLENGKLIHVVYIHPKKLAIASFGWRA